jgi:AcrR family transcriptional regulator
MTGSAGDPRTVPFDLVAAFEAGQPPEDGYTGRILRAALDQFVDVGIRRSTVADVARRAGLSRVTVYRRFPRKADLVRAVALAELRRFLAGLDAAAAELPTAADRLVEGFVACVRAVRTHPLLLRLLGTEPEALLPLLTLDFAPWLALARHVLAERLVLDGAALPAGVDAQALAEVGVRLAVSHLLTRDGSHPLDTDEQVRAYAARYLAPIAGAAVAGRPRRWSVRRASAGVLTCGVAQAGWATRRMAGSRRSTSGSTSATGTGRASSFDSEVTPASAIPQGTIRSYQLRSGSQLRAKPCMVTPWLTRMPMAATLRAGPRESAGTHTPLRRSTRAAATPSSAHTAMSIASRRRT